LTDTCVSPLFLHLWAETRTRQHVSVAQAAPASLRTLHSLLSGSKLSTQVSYLFSANLVSVVLIRRIQGVSRALERTQR